MKPTGPNDISAMKKLTVLGSVNQDFVLQVEHFPKPGETVTGGNFQSFDGGKGANQAVAARRMGSHTQLLACVGSDAYGTAIKNRLNQMGIDTTLVVESQEADTGCAFIFIDSQGENSIGISPGANHHLNSRLIDINENQLSDTDWLLMQLETPISTVQRAAEITQSSGGRVILNPAPAQPLPPQLLQHVDVITPNQSEAELLTGIKVVDEASWNQAASILHDLGVPTVIITLGHQGVWFSRQGYGKMIPGFSVPALDTTGAGDCFNGVLASALLAGSNMEAAISVAQAAAALSVGRFGAQAAMPSKDEVDKFLRNATQQQEYECP